MAHPEEIADESIPQVVFLGRSNVGKSTIINNLTHLKPPIRTSAVPGSTKVINFYLINKSVYFVDLPGYGYAKTSFEEKKRLDDLIFWYLLDSGSYFKLIIIIIDAFVGPTKDDMDIISGLEGRKMNIVIVANKTDKIKKSRFKNRMDEITRQMGNHKVIPFSSKSKIGIGALVNEIFEK